MTATLLSILLGLICGGILAFAVRGTDGTRRVWRSVVAGLPLMVAMTAWALWRNSFPATFGPFVLVTGWIAIAGRGKKDEGSEVDR